MPKSENFAVSDEDTIYICCKATKRDGKTNIFKTSHLKLNKGAIVKLYSKIDFTLLHFRLEKSRARTKIMNEMPDIDVR